MCHHVGKWHLGMSNWGVIPKGRGFDTSLVCFEGAEDHMIQRSCNDPMCLAPITDASSGMCPSTNANGSCPYDLWHDDAPATELAGRRFSGYLFNDQAVANVMGHDTSNASAPLFMYLAPQSSHSPLQAPQEFVERYPADWYLDRRLYAAMCSVWDEVLGNVTSGQGHVGHLARGLQRRQRRPRVLVD